MTARAKQAQLGLDKKQAAARKAAADKEARQKMAAELRSLKAKLATSMAAAVRKPWPQAAVFCLLALIAAQTPIGAHQWDSLAAAYAVDCEANGWSIRDGAECRQKFSKLKTAVSTPHQ